MNINNLQLKIEFYQNNSKKILSGIFPIISNNSKICSFNNNIDILDKNNSILHSPYVITNGSNLISQENIIDIKNKTYTQNYYCSICAINSLAKIYDNPTPLKLKYIDTQNSFTNIYTIAYNKDIDKQIGGFIDYKNQNIIKQQNLKWSSQISAQNGTKCNLYWQTLNQNSILIDLPIQNIEVSYNGEFYSNSTATTEILYNKKSFGGFFNKIGFTCRQYTTEKESPSSIILENKKHFYNLNSLLLRQLKEISLKNIYNVQLQNLDLAKLNIINSKISINVKNNHLSNVSGYYGIINSKFKLSELTDYSNLSGTIFNVIETSNNFISFNEDLTYPKGYSIILSNNLQSNITQNKLFNVETYSNLGNQIWTATTIKAEKKNNCYKHGLESHSHKSYGSAISLMTKGQLFPTQSVISHTLYNNNNYKYVIQDYKKCSYYPLESTINEQLIPQQNILPVGAIIGFYQFKRNNEWLPQVPYGFYKLDQSSTTQVLLNGDDPGSLTYNLELGKIYGVNANGIISLPKGSQIIFNNNTCRIIKIIKYSEYWEKV